MSTISASTTTTTAYKVTADTSGSLILQTGSGPTTAVTIDGSQNVGVGVTPNAWLSSLKAQQIGTSLSLWGTSTGSNNAGIESNSYINTAGNSIYISTQYATRYQQYLGQHIWYNAPSGTAGNAITFTQAMTLTSGGSLLVNKTAADTTSPGVEIYNNSNQAGRLNITKNTSGNFNAIANYYSGTYVGGVNYDNTSTSFPSASDVRLKKDIVEAGSASAKIDQIHIVSHGWKHDDAVVEFGVIAQELFTVAPQAVSAGDDGEEVEITWGVDYSKLVPMLIKAHQEQQALITQLQADVAALKGAA